MTHPYTQQNDSPIQPTKRLACTTNKRLTYTANKTNLRHCTAVT